MNTEAANYFQKAVDPFVNDYGTSTRNYSNEALLGYGAVTGDMTLHDVVQKAMLEFERVPLAYSGIRIRDDAKLFLFMNADVMVYQPLLPENEKLTLLEKIYGDVVSILLGALEGVRESGQIEISSHAVLSACAAKWGRLKLLSADSW